MWMWMRRIGFTVCLVGLGGWDACNKERPPEQRPLPPELQIRDVWQAQIDATRLMGEQSLCYGQAGKATQWTGKETVNVATGGFACWSACGANRQAVCPANAEHPCTVVVRAPSVTVTPEKP